jgi:hypothetical protein
MIITGATLNNVGFVNDNYYVINGLALNLEPTTGAMSSSTWTDTVAGNNATMVSSPSYVVGTGYTLNGTTQYGTVPSISGVTNFNNTNNYSIEVWTYLNATQNDTGTGDNDIVEKWASDNSSTYPYVIRYVRGSASIIIGCYNGTANPVASMTVTTNGWQQVIGTFNFTGGLLTAYKNGASITTASLTGVTGVSNNSLLGLGTRLQYSASPINHVTGQIGIVRIYNRALSAAEVFQNFSYNRQGYGI